MNDPDLLQAIAPVVSAFDQLDIPYHIGGSVASSVYGLARTTLDADLVADMKSLHIGPLVERLESGYYIDPDTIAEAIEGRSSFNLVHLETMLKVAIFIVKDSPYAREAFRRRRKDTLHEEHRSEWYIASPEDVILNKLHWFRSGGHVSERQWGDVIGVFKVQGDQLDMAYLQRWAADLGLADLMEQALQEAGLSPR